MDSEEEANEKKRVQYEGTDFDQSGSFVGGKFQKHAVKRPVLKSSFAAAFHTILNKKLDEDKTETPILAKYKRPAKEVSEEMKKENELKQKRLEKEKLRLMGRHIPVAEDEDHEREL